MVVQVEVSPVGGGDALREGRSGAPAHPAAPGADGGGASAPAHEAIVPGTGRRVAASAALRTDAPVLDLDGEWDFRWSPSPSAPLDMLDGPLPGPGWTTITLPAHWSMPEQPGPDGPQYTNVVYPFPLDPPHVPDQNPTGDHRRVFDLPEDWPADGAVHLRTEGIESFARIWLNGTEVGTRQGSRLTQDFDVTGLLRERGNVLVIRVVQWSAGSYVEDQDQWWLPGIFRSVSLRHRPARRIDDAWLDGDLAEDGTGLLHVELSAPAGAWPLTVAIPELGLVHEVTAPGKVAPLEVPGVEPWTAETPRRYRATVSSAEETVEITVGFRRVEVEDGVLRVNGRPIILRGVNRHEWDPRTGRVIDLEVAREELLAMKRANVDAVRTAHYPPDARWLDLADEIGMWVMLEADVETHGFEGEGWAGNPADDPAWRDLLLDRIVRTVERDKNHPSIIMWSLGNESATGQNLAAMSDWLRTRDPRRPVHYEGDHAGAYTDVYARMYPALEEIRSWLAPEGPVAVAHHAASRITDREAARVRSKPLILVEYLHAMGTGPGGVADYAALIEEHERIAGGFVWEWKDHAVAVEAADGSRRWRYGGDFGEPLHDGNFVIDGLADAENRPHPGLLHWAESVAPVRGRWDDEDGAEGRLLIESRRQFTTTEDLVLAWRYEVDGRPAAEGTVALGPLAPAATHTVPTPEALAGALRRPQDEASECFLLLEIQLAAATPWAAAGHVLSRRQHRVRPPRRPAAPAPTSQPVPILRDAEGFAVADEDGAGGFRFSPAGRLVRLGGLELDEHGIDLWRAPTDNDEGHGALDYEAADPALTRGAGGGARGPSSADRWRARGLDRLVTTTRGVRLEEGALVVERRLAPAGSALAVDTRLIWTAQLLEEGPEAGTVLDCRIEVSPRGTWEGTWPRVGLHLVLPAGEDREAWEAEWFGLGPEESWSDLRVATWTGRHRLPLTALHHPRVRPQTTGHRGELRELAVRRPDGSALVVRTLEGDPGFTLSPWSPHELQVPHHDVLPRSESWHLHLDLAQHGVGTRSCGPDVRPEHQLRPGRVGATFRFRAESACDAANGPSAAPRAASHHP